MRTLSLKDFKGNKDSYYNFKRSYQESVKKLHEAMRHSTFEELARFLVDDSKKS